MWISSHQIKKRSILFSDGHRMKAALLPFFDHNGQIVSVLVCSHRKEQVFYIPVSAFYRVPWMGSIKLDIPRHGSASPAYFTCEIEGLWHYDPWWLMKKPQYAWLGCEVINAIKKSNIVGRTERPVDGLLYDFNKRRIWRAAIQTKTEAHVLFADFDRLGLKPRIKTNPPSVKVEVAETWGEWRIAEGWKTWPGCQN